MKRISEKALLALRCLCLLLGLQSTPLLAATFAETGTDTSTPIIFVHGYSGSGSNWDIMASWFVRDGYPSAKLYRFNYNSLTASNKTSASQLATFINSVRSKNGNAPVTIIAHSNGGLVARWYLAQLGGSAAVKRFISLGSPHAGTTSAYSCFSPACTEMRPNSTFLKTLNGLGCDISLWSARDEIINPVQSAQCATSLQTADVSHIGLILTASVYDQVRTQL